MNKKILVLYYSQSGQLGEIVSSLTAPLAAAGNTVETIAVVPSQPFPFPWTGKVFFAAMPDSVLGVPAPLQPFAFKEKAYDLVIIGYQPWFLSPSIPVNSFLQLDTVKTILKDTPVVTVTGARNMWISAVERIRAYLKEVGARQVGNIALVDRHANPVSVVTILYWMFTGKRDRYLGIFPRPGVADDDVARCAEFGVTIGRHLDGNDFTGMQEELLAQKALEVKYSLMFIESKARRIFAVWANFIAKRKKRTGWLVAFKYYLIIALFIAAPIILTIDAIFFKPFLAGRIKRQKQYYSGVN